PLQPLAVRAWSDHLEASLPQAVEGHYVATHWLATFALLALEDTAAGCALALAVIPARYRRTRPRPDSWGYRYRSSVRPRAPSRGPYQMPCDSRRAGHAHGSAIHWYDAYPSRPRSCARDRCADCSGRCLPDACRPRYTSAW